MQSVSTVRRSNMLLKKSKKSNRKQIYVTIDFYLNIAMRRLINRTLPMVINPINKKNTTYPLN